MKKIYAMVANYSFGIVITLAILLLCVAVTQDRAAPARHDDPLVPLALSGVFSVDGGAWQKLQPDTSFEHLDCHTVTIEGNFKQDIPQGQELLLFIRNMDVTLKVNGREIYSFIGGKDDSPFRSFGMTWGKIESSKLSARSYVELTMSSDRLLGGKVQHLMDNMLAGRYYSLYGKMLDDSLPFLLTAIFAILLGVLSTLLALVARAFHLPQVAKAVALSFFAMINGLWILINVNYRYLPLLISNPYLASMLDMLSIYLLPVVFGLMFKAYISRRFMPFIEKLFTVQCLLVVIAFALQAGGLVQLFAAQNAFILVSLVLFLLSLAFILFDAVKLKNRQAGVMLLSILPAMVTILMEIFRSFVLKVPPNYVVSSIGCFITLLLQLFQVTYMIKCGSDDAIRAQQMENERVQSQISIILSQVQPQFLHNILTAVGQLCDSDSIKAKRAIAEVSSYLSVNLESLSQKELIPFEQELTHVKTYLSLEKVRFQSGINVVYDIQVSDFLIPVLTIQPLVENAVRHGLRKNTNGGTIVISTRDTERWTIITVSDDGAGFAQNQPVTDGKQHIGIPIVRSRLKSQCAGALDIKSSIGAGTVAMVTLPKGDAS